MWILTTTGNVDQWIVDEVIIPVRHNQSAADDLKLISDCVLTALQKKPQPGQHWCLTMPLRWSSHKTSSWTELEGRIISCFSMAPWQRVSCPSMLSVAIHFLSARMRISRLLGVSMRQLHSGSSWASSMADPKVSVTAQSRTWYINLVTGNHFHFNKQVKNAGNHLSREKVECFVKNWQMNSADTNTRGV